MIPSATVVAVSIAARMVGILGMGISVVLVVLSAVGFCWCLDRRIWCWMSRAKGLSKLRLGGFCIALRFATFRDAVFLQSPVLQG